MASSGIKRTLRAALIALIPLAAAACEEPATGPASGDPAAPPPVAAAQSPGSEGPSPAQAADPSALDGTHWRLLEFQSMDDAIGRTVVDDPNRYELNFGPDGLTVKLDCNRGSGSWKATPATPTEGQMELTLTTSTMALCPPPSLGEQLARDLPHMRSYRLVDGRLALSLMADAGIYLWEPLKGAAE